jgi:hypothetical protein
VEEGQTIERWDRVGEFRKRLVREKERITVTNHRREEGLKEQSDQCMDSGLSWSYGEKH